MADADPVPGVSVSGMLLQKHHEFGEAVNRILATLEAGGVPAAARAFGALAHRIRRHIELEDRRLIPIFEERTGLREDGPTAMLRSEHREILARLGRIRAALRQPDNAAEATALVLSLRALLEDHTLREETTFYPTCDRLLDKTERRRVLRTLARKGR